MNRPSNMTTFSGTLASCAGLALLLGAVACGDQADPTYEGEVLALVEGTIEKDPGFAVSDAEVSLAWKEGPDEDTNHRWIAERVRVKGEFPANFSLAVRTLPPAKAIIESPDGTKMAGAAVIVTKPGALEGAVDFRKVPAGTLLGAVANKAVVYLAQDVGASSTFAALQGGPAKRGFHFLEYVTVDQAEGDRRMDQCRRVTVDPKVRDLYCAEGVSTDNFPKLSPISTALRVKLAPDAKFPFLGEDEADEGDTGPDSSAEDRKRDAAPSKP